MLKTVSFSLAAVALAGSAMAGSHAQKWDMPMAYAASNFHSEHGVIFADAVRDATGGAIDITVHPGGSLFGGADIKRAVQTGQAPIGERLLSAHQNESALFGVDSIPFLATSYEDSDKLIHAAQGAIAAELDSQNLHLLYSCPWPGQGLYFKKAVNSKADTQGVKFRSYNSATARLAELMGMLPVQVEAAELSQALATGVAESFVSSGSTGYDRKVWEQLSHFYEVNAWMPRNYVFVNKQVWEDLDADMQAAVQGAADDTAAKCTAKSAELAGWYLEQLAANGMNVQPAGDELRADLEAIGATMTAEWMEAAGDAGKAVIDAYKGM